MCIESYRKVVIVNHCCLILLNGGNHTDASECYHLLLVLSVTSSASAESISLSLVSVQSGYWLETHYVDLLT